MTNEISRADLRAPDYFGHLLRACGRKSSSRG